MLQLERSTQWYFSNEGKAAFEKASLQERADLIQTYLQNISNHTFDNVAKRERFNLRCYYFALFLADAIYGSALPYATYPVLIDPDTNPFLSYWMKTKDFDLIHSSAVHASFMDILRKENESMQGASSAELIMTSITDEAESQGLSGFSSEAFAKMPVPMELSLSPQLRPIALKIGWLCEKIVRQDLVAECQPAKKVSKPAFFRIGLISAVALVVIAILISIFAPIDRSKFVKNTDGSKIGLSLSNWEAVQDPIASFDISIENGFDRDLAGLDIELQFYDGNNDLIQTTTLNLSGYMPAQEEKTLTVKLHNDVVEALYWYSTSEIGITAQITEINFNDSFGNDPPVDNGKHVLKDSKKPDNSKKEDLESKLETALAILNAADAKGINFETQIAEVGTVLDPIWEDVIRDRSSLEKIYQEATHHEQNREYEKAYILFGLLGTIDYADSTDRAQSCALAANRY